MKVIFIILFMFTQFWVFGQELLAEYNKIVVTAEINEINDTLFVNLEIVNKGNESIFIFDNRIYFYYIPQVVNLYIGKNNKHGNEFSNFPVSLLEIKVNENYNKNIMVMNFFEPNPVLFSELKNVNFKIYLNFNYLYYFNEIQKINNRLYVIEYGEILDNYKSLKVIYSTP